MTQQPQGEGTEGQTGQPPQEQAPQGAEQQVQQPPEPGLVAVQGTDDSGNPTIDWVYPADLTGAETPPAAGEPGQQPGQAPAAQPQQAGLTDAMRLLLTPEGRQAMALVMQGQEANQEAARRMEATQQEIKGLMEKVKAGGEDAEQAKLELADKVIQQQATSAQMESLMEAAQEQVYGQVLGPLVKELPEEQRLKVFTLQGDNAEVVKEVLDMVVEARMQGKQQESQQQAAGEQAAMNQQVAERHTGVPQGSAAQEKMRRAPASPPGPAIPPEKGQPVPIVPGQTVDLDGLYEAATEQARQS